MLEQIDAWLTSNNLTYNAERRDFAFATDGPWDLMHFLDGESLSSHARPQGLRTYCTYWPRAPAFCALYVPEAQGSLPPGSHVLYVRGTRTRLGRTVAPRTVVITPGECERKGIRKPAYFDKWVNLKDLYADFYKVRLGLGLSLGLGLGVGVGVGVGLG